MLFFIASLLLGFYPPQVVSVRHHVISAGGGCTPVSGYAHCRTLTVDHTQVSSTLADFPVLVSTTLGGSRIQNASCFDIVFTSDAGGTTLIPWQQETCTQSTGAIVDWVLCSSCSSSADTNFYVSYDNGSISTAQNTGSNAPTAVWDGNFAAVYHLGNGATLSGADSTINGQNDTANISLTAAAGQIDGALSNAGSGVLKLPGSIVSSNVLTVSLWLNVAAVNAYQGVFAIYNGNDSDSMEILVDNGSARLSGGNFNNRAFTATSSIVPSTWYYVTLTSDGTTTAMLLNGVSSGTTGTTHFTTFSNIAGISARPAGLSMTGLVDEVRISSVVRAGAWIAAEYANQKTGQTFLTVGSEV